MRTTKNDDAILTMIRTLGLADVEMLSAVCSYAPERGRKHGFGAWGVRRAAERLLHGNHLHRLWSHRDPKFRHDRGSKRQVFLLSTKGAQRLGDSARPSLALDRRFQKLRDPRREYILEHELMVAHFHACLIALSRKHPNLLGIDLWEKGVGISVEHPDGHPLRFTPDARFRLKSQALYRAWWFFLEADTGNERIESDDPERRTISQKVERYSKLMKFGNISKCFPGMYGFYVLFLTPKRSSEENILSGRERSIFEAVRQNALPEFHSNFRVLSETDVKLDHPEYLLESLMWVCGAAPERVPLLPRP